MKYNERLALSNDKDLTEKYEDLADEVSVRDISERGVDLVWMYHLNVNAMHIIIQIQYTKNRNPGRFKLGTTLSWPNRSIEL